MFKSGSESVPSRTQIPMREEDCEIKGRENDQMNRWKRSIWDTDRLQKPPENKKIENEIRDETMQTLGKSWMNRSFPTASARYEMDSNAEPGIFWTMIICCNKKYASSAQSQDHSHSARRNNRSTQMKIQLVTGIIIECCNSPIDYREHSSSTETVAHGCPSNQSRSTLLPMIWNINCHRTSWSKLNHSKRIILYEFLRNGHQMGSHSLLSNCCCNPLHV